MNQERPHYIYRGCGREIAGNAAPFFRTIPSCRLGLWENACGSRRCIRYQYDMLEPPVGGFGPCKMHKKVNGHIRAMKSLQMTVNHTDSVVSGERCYFFQKFTTKRHRGDTDTGTGTHRRRTADTSTPSKQRDRYGVTHSTHHSEYFFPGTLHIDYFRYRYGLVA